MSADPSATHLDMKHAPLTRGSDFHRTRAPRKAVILRVETAAIRPTGDAR